VTERRGRMHKKLLETRIYEHFKEAALEHNVWRTRFGWGCRPVV